MLKPYNVIKKIVCVFSVIGLIIGGYFGCAYAESSVQSATKIAVISVPDGQILHAVATTPVNSKYIASGQVVTMVLDRDFCFNSKVIAPVNSMLFGNVISVSRKNGEKPAELLLRFNQLVTPYGIKIPVSAIIKTAEKSGKISSTEARYYDDNGNIDIPVATAVDLVLIQPITVNPEVYNSNY